MAPVALACAVMLLGSVAQSAAGTDGDQREESSVATKRPAHPREKTKLKRRWGVNAIGVRAVVAGYMLVFKDRVLDAEKAKPLFERRFKPVLVDEATGARFAVPAPQTTGPLRNSNTPQEGRIYWMAFGNPGQYVKPGSEVRIEIGEFDSGRLVVE